MSLPVISPWIKFLKTESVKRDKFPVSIPGIHFCVASLSLSIRKLRDLRRRYSTNIAKLKNYACVYKGNKKTPEDFYAGFVGISNNYVEWHWKLLSSVSTTNVCRRDRDVLLNTRDDELQIRVPLILKTKLTSILPPYMLRVWGSSLTFSFRLR